MISGTQLLRGPAASAALVVPPPVQPWDGGQRLRGDVELGPAAAVGRVGGLGVAGAAESEQGRDHGVVRGFVVRVEVAVQKGVGERFVIAMGAACGAHEVGEGPALLNWGAPRIPDSGPW